MGGRRRRTDRQEGKPEPTEETAEAEAGGRAHRNRDARGRRCHWRARRANQTTNRGAENGHRTARPTRPKEQPGRTQARKSTRSARGGSDSATTRNSGSDQRKTEKRQEPSCARTRSSRDRNPRGRGSSRQDGLSGHATGKPAMEFPVNNAKKRATAPLGSHTGPDKTRDAADSESMHETADVGQEPGNRAERYQCKSRQADTPPPGICTSLGSDYPRIRSSRWTMTLRCLRLSEDRARPRSR